MPRVFWIISVIVGVIMALVIAFAVTSSNKSSTSVDKTGKTATKGQTTIEYWRPIDEPEVFREIINRFESQNPSVKIKYVKKDPASYQRDSLTAISNQKGPDIWAIPNSWVGGFKDALIPAPTATLLGKNTKSIDLSKYLDTKYPPIVKDELLIDNQVYGLPLSIDTLALYVNKKVLRDKANALRKTKTDFDESLFSQGPRTWDEVARIAEIFHQAGDSPSAIALGATGNISKPQDILATMMMQSGAKMVSDDLQTSTFNLPQQKSDGSPYNPGLQALEFYTSFASPGSSIYSWSDSQPSSIDAFLKGDVAMILGYPTLKQTLEQKSPNFNYSILPLPQIKEAAKPVDFASYYVETVPKSSKNQTAAWSFINYLSSTAQSAYSSASGRPSPRRVNTVPETIYDRISFGQPFRFQSMSAKSWYRGAKPQDVEKIFADMITSVNAGVSPQTAIDSSATSITSILRDNSATPAVGSINP